MNTDQLIKQFITIAKQLDTTVDVINKSTSDLDKALLKTTTDDGDIILTGPHDMDPQLIKLFKIFSESKP